MSAATNASERTVLRQGIFMRRKIASSQVIRQRNFGPMLAQFGVHMTFGAHSRGSQRMALIDFTQTDARDGAEASVRTGNVG